MKLLPPNQRRDLLAPYLAKASINWAHIVLAQFMNEHFIERALTVNFDNLLARACGLLSLYPAIYDFGSAPTANVSVIVSPAIIHLHGQGHGVVLLNTEEETRVHAAKIAPVLRQSMDRPLIIVGYSGTTDDILRIVRDYYIGSEYLYWLSRDDTPDPTVRAAAEPHSYFKCVGGIDADRFLIELAQKLRCWPPAICTNPIGHLLAELKPVADYPTIPGNEVNVLATTRSRLAELEASEKRKEQATQKIEKLFFEGRYEEVFTLFETERSAGRPTDALRNRAAAALMLLGNSIYNEGLKANDRAVAGELFKRAEERYESALQITPNDSVAIYNLGVALAARARNVSDVGIANELLRQAENRFEAAVRIKPDYAEALNNWGVALSDRARNTNNREAANQLSESAATKYELALRYAPDNLNALVNWGNTFLCRARLSSDPGTAREFFRQAQVKYDEALHAKPNWIEPLLSFGVACLEWAKFEPDGDSAKELLRTAERKLKLAENLGSEQTYNLACVYALLGNSVDCRTALETGEKAGTLPQLDQLRSDDDLKSVHNESWFVELIERMRARLA
ncbi:MAG: hypothetical protein WA268_17380 [Xanthobacteraceae bacterium]